MGIYYMGIYIYIYMWEYIDGNINYMGTFLLYFWDYIWEYMGNNEI